MTNKKMIIDTEFIDDLKNPIFIKARGEDGAFIYCNQAFLDFFGLSREAIIDHPASEFLSKTLANFLQETDRSLEEMAEKNGVKGRTTLKNKTSILLKKSIVYNAESEVEGFIGMIEIASQKSQGPLGKELPNLSKREVEVLTYLTEGVSVKVIAEMLNLSRYTVADHIKSIYLKLGVHSKTEAVCKVLTQPTAPQIDW